MTYRTFSLAVLTINALYAPACSAMFFPMISYAAGVLTGRRSGPRLSNAELLDSCTKLAAQLNSQAKGQSATTPINVTNAGKTSSAAKATIDGAAEIIKNAKAEGPVNINIHVNEYNTTETNSANYTSQKPDSTDPTNSTLKNNLSTTSNPFSRAWQWIKTHKIRAMLSFLGGTYVTTQSYLWYLSHQLQDKSCWSFWKNQLTLEELFRYRQTTLTKEIQEAIQHRYQSAGHTEDVVTPLTRFIKDVDNEIKLLQRYQSCVNGLSILFMSKLFFLNNALVKEIGNRLNRLEFIKSIAVSGTNNGAQPPIAASSFTAKK